MAGSPNIFFTVNCGRRRRILWNDRARKHAEHLGYNIRLNENDGPLTKTQWADLFEGVEALITTWGAPKLDAEVLAKNTTLKIVGHAAGSVAPVVSEELFRRGIKLVTANRIMARYVAQWNLMATFMGLRGVVKCAQFGNDHPMQWENRDFYTPITDAVIGIWGLGDISKYLIEMLKPFQPARILVHSSYITDETAAGLGVTKADFDELFAASDVIHLLTGMTPENKGKIGAKQLAMIKDGATLTNAARAHLLQEDALMAELKKERFTAIFDVYHTEPLPEDSPLRNMPNVILTPHCAGHGSHERFVECVLDEFVRFFKGQPLQHEISAKRAAKMTVEMLNKNKPKPPQPE